MGRLHKHIILDSSDLSEINELLISGTHPSRVFARCQMLKYNALGKKAEEIATLLETSRHRVLRTLKRYESDGLSYALYERPRSGSPAKVHSKTEALITMIACSDAPDGRSCWTVKLINDRLVELSAPEDKSLSDETVRLVLKKVNSSLGSSGCGVLVKSQGII